MEESPRTPGRQLSTENQLGFLNKLKKLEEYGGSECGRAADVARMDEAASKIDCEMIFIEPMDWMGDVLSKPSGAVHCSNKACQIVIGAYDWNGTRCSCGCVVTPAFFIEKSKLLSKERAGAKIAKERGKRK